MSPQIESEASPPIRVETVVIGAGLAGLAAALELTDHGRSCLVLEARDRVGGRVHTIRSPFSDGLHGEAGAEYINGGHTHVQRLMERFNLLNGQRPSAPRLYAFLDQQALGRTVASAGPEVAKDLRRLGRRVSALGRRIPDPWQPWAAPAARELDARSVRAWLDETELEPFTRAYLSVWHRLDYSIENDRISLLQLARDDRLYRDEPGAGVGRPREGMDALPRAMAAVLGDRVALETEVAALEQRDNHVVVRYTRRGVPGAVSALRAIVAVPATTLRNIQISPPLPELQHAAVERLEYGTVVKVLLQFRERFWLRERRIRGIMTDLPFLSAWDATKDQPGSRGILGTYTAGANGRALLDMTHEARIGWCLSQLGQIFPGASDLFEVGYAATWDREPFTRGTYSYFAPGQMVPFSEQLARPFGRLHFAGEHTDAWQATMNGAISSGQRAAREAVAGDQWRQAY